MATWHLPRGFLLRRRSQRPAARSASPRSTPGDQRCAGDGGGRLHAESRPRRLRCASSQERAPSADVRGLVICSGNANACTGRRGLDDARRMTAVAAEVVGCRETQMLVCSTGVIGRPLPMPVIESGIRAAAPAFAPTAAGLDDLAHAILTTDTRASRSCTRSLPFDEVRRDSDRRLQAPR